MADKALHALSCCLSEFMLILSLPRLLSAAKVVVGAKLIDLNLFTLTKKNFKLLITYLIEETTEVTKQLYFTDFWLGGMWVI